MMFVAHVYIPVYPNDGTLFPIETIADVRIPIVEKWGGLTVIHDAQGIAAGWPIEEVDVYEVLCDEESPTAVENWWFSYANWARRFLSQSELLVCVWPAVALRATR